MHQLLFILHILICLALVVLVLIQHGKGADMGVAFGSGSAHSMFGSQGSGSFLVKMTTLFAIAFFVMNLALGYVSNTVSETPDYLKHASPLRQAAVKLDKTLPASAAEPVAVPVSKANAEKTDAQDELSPSSIVDQVNTAPMSDVSQPGSKAPEAPLPQTPQRRQQTAGRVSAGRSKVVGGKK